MVPRGDLCSRYCTVEILGRKGEALGKNLDYVVGALVLFWDAV